MTTETDPDSTRDDNESIGLFEPLVVSQGARSRGRLNDLARTLAEKSTALCSSLPAPLVDAIANLITAVNCFYSNLIEGHEIDLVDLKRAMEGDLSEEQGRRVLQLEALAHMSAQKWLDTVSAAPFSVPTILEIHRRFYELLPPELLSVSSVDGSKQRTVEPGILRSMDVKIGRHVAISPGAVPRFLARMEQGYRSAHRGERIVMAACGHHRLLWVHPFEDGNGRVARLVLHQAFARAIDARSLWSASRGIALREKEYRAHLEACDEPRRGSLDGRGSLSEGALASFAAFILERSIDQIDFMSALLHPLQLAGRVLDGADEMISAGVLKQGSQQVLKEMLHRGHQAGADGQSSDDRLPDRPIAAAFSRAISERPRLARYHLLAAKRSSGLRDADQWNLFMISSHTLTSFDRSTFRKHLARRLLQFASDVLDFKTPAVVHDLLGPVRLRVVQQFFDAALGLVSRPLSRWAHQT